MLSKPARAVTYAPSGQPGWRPHSRRATRRKLVRTGIIGRPPSRAVSPAVPERNRVPHSGADAACARAQRGKAMVNDLAADGTPRHKPDRSKSAAADVVIPPTTARNWQRTTTVRGHAPATGEQPGPVNRVDERSCLCGWLWQNFAPAPAAARWSAAAPSRFPRHRFAPRWRRSIQPPKCGRDWSSAQYGSGSPPARPSAPAPSSASAASSPAAPIIPASPPM